MIISNKMRRVIQILLLCVGLLNNQCWAQAMNNPYLLDARGLTEAQLIQLEQSAPKDGWVVFKYYGQDFVFNYSNKEYRLRLAAKCFDNKKSPGFLIEYSNSYGKGDLVGVDFISSANDDDFTKVVFWIDDKNYGNPFSDDKPRFDTFIKDLKLARRLTIKIWYNEFNPETGKDEWVLNRSIDFKTANPKALDTAVECN